MDAAKNLKRIMDRGKKKPSKFIYTRIVRNGRKVVIRKRSKASQAALVRAENKAF